jgi:flagellar hook-associated protein 2
MATGSVSSTGVGSGLDVAAIISSLMAVERQPLLRLQSAEASMQTKLSAFGQIQSTVSALRDAAAKLHAADTFKQATTTSGDATTVTATATTNAMPGSYAVSVTALAATQSVVSPAGQYANATAVVGTGTLTIRLGSWDAARTAFSPKGGGADVAVVIGAGDDTLEKVRDKINAANAGVTASIITDSSGARLALQSSETGAANGFRVLAADDDGASTDAAGLSRLAYDGAATGSQLTFARAAADAAATINGIAVSSTSNTLADVVQGITFNLLKVPAPAAAVNVDVRRNTDAVKAAVTAFVGAYNALDKLLGDATKYDPVAKQGALLQGDATTVGLQSRLRMLVGQPNQASSAFGSLSAIGIQLQKDGSLKLDDAKLATAMGNFAELTKALGNVDAAMPGLNGFGKRFALWADEQLATGGTLPGKTQSIQSRIAAMQKDQERLSDRLVAVEQRLKAQYTQLDTVMSKMNALQSYVKQQFYFDNDKND